MWNAIVLTVLISLAGFYSLKGQETLASAKSGDAHRVAENMAIYRQAVEDYFKGSSDTNISVSEATLKATGALPSWASLYTQDGAVLWNNYRDADGVIYIYAAKTPAININGELAELAHYSILAGVYKSGYTTMFSPQFGDTQIPLTALAGKVQDGAPVWIAMSE